MARFENGYIKLYRAVIQGDIGGSGVQLAVWVTLLTWATRFESKIRWKGHPRIVPPGTVLTGIREIAAQLGFSKDSTGRALRALASRDSIRIETATRGTLITVCNWDQYQGSDDEDATPARHKRATGATLAGRQPDLIGELKNKRSICAFDLEAAYQRFPRKKGKSPGLKKLAKEIKTQQDYDRLLNAVEAFTREYVGKDPQYVPYFSTFASNWTDYLESPPLAPQGKLKTFDAAGNEVEVAHA